MGDADEASEARALPGGILASQVHALPRHGLQRLLPLEDHAAPLLIDQGDGAPRWYQRDNWRVFSPLTVAEEGIGTTIARFRLDSGDEATLSRDPSSARLYAPFDLAAAYDANVSETAALATRQWNSQPGN
jgi:hypothetical protein